MTHQAKVGETWIERTSGRRSTITEIHGGEYATVETVVVPGVVASVRRVDIVNGRLADHDRDQGGRDARPLHLGKVPVTTTVTVSDVYMIVSALCEYAPFEAHEARRRDLLVETLRARADEAVRDGKRRGVPTFAQHREAAA